MKPIICKNTMKYENERYHWFDCDLPLVFEDNDDLIPTNTPLVLLVKQINTGYIYQVLATLETGKYTQGYSFNIFYGNPDINCRVIKYSKINPEILELFPVDSNESYMCMNCGNTLPSSMFSMINIHPINYCPYCGSLKLPRFSYDLINEHCKNLKD